MSKIFTIHLGWDTLETAILGILISRVVVIMGIAVIFFLVTVFRMVVMMMRLAMIMTAIFNYFIYEISKRRY